MTTTQHKRIHYMKVAQQKRKKNLLKKNKLNEMNKKWKSLKTNSIRRYLKNAKRATNNTNNYKKKKKRRIKYKQTLKVKTYKKNVK